MKKRLHIALAVAIAAALFIGVLMGQTILDTSVAYAQQIFQHVIAGKLTVINDADLRGAVSVTGAVTASGSLTGDDVVTTDDATVGDDLLVGGYLKFTPQDVITVTNNSVITPTGSLQYLTSAATRGTRLVVTTTVPAGTIQIFRVATGSSGVTLTDTAPLCLVGNAVLTAGDTLGLLHNGVCWEQLFKNDNG
jgi:hypothetical protein